MNIKQSDSCSSLVSFKGLKADWAGILEEDKEYNWLLGSQSRSDAVTYFKLYNFNETAYVIHSLVTLLIILF